MTNPAGTAKISHAPKKIPNLKDYELEDEEEKTSGDPESSERARLDSMKA